MNRAEIKVVAVLGEIIVYQCANEFCTTKYFYEHRRYCSRKCKLETFFRRTEEAIKLGAKKSRLTRGGHKWREYSLFKNEVFSERNGKCDLCSQKAIYLHHIKSPRKLPLLELVKSNVLILCEECHIKKHPELSRKFFENSLFAKLMRKKWLSEKI